MASRAVSARASSRLRLVPVPAAGSRASKAERERAGTRTVLLLLVPTALLLGVGLIMVFSASSVAAYARYGSSFLFFQRQAVYAGVGVVGLLLLSRMPYAIWSRLAVPFLAATGILLVLVLHSGAGTSAGGSSRWLAVGPITIQPSEIVKLALVAFAATVLTRKAALLDDVGHLLLPLLPVTALVCWLVMRQPDLGTTVILAGTIFVLLFIAGVRLRYLGMAGIAGLAIGWILIMSAAYRRARFLSFLSPWKDPQNAGYHLIQSYIALGSGGLFGVGLGASRQKWMYVPNAHTDFIFSILGEELGLLVAICVLGLFAVLLYGGIRVAARAPDTFGRLLASGIVAWLGLQTIVNLGAVTGLLPITGVPLPLLSYGGSSLVVTLGAIGILVNIARTPAVPARSRKDPT
jgi:cell division protein FtsW